MHGFLEYSRPGKVPWATFGILCLGTVYGAQKTANVNDLSLYAIHALVYAGERSRD